MENTLKWLGSMSVPRSRFVCYDDGTCRRRMKKKVVPNMPLHPGPESAIALSFPVENLTLPADSRNYVMYYFELPEAENPYVLIADTLNSQPISTILGLFDGTGKLLTINVAPNSGGVLSKIEIVDLNPGFYYLVVGLNGNNYGLQFGGSEFFVSYYGDPSAGGTSTSDIVLNLTVTSTPSPFGYAEYPFPPPISTQIASPVTDLVVGLDPVNWYVITLPGSQPSWTLSANTLGSTGSPDTEIALYNSLGYLFVQNDDSGGTGTSSFSMSRLLPGTYYIAVGGYDIRFEEGFNASGGTGNSGNVRLTVSWS